MNKQIFLQLGSGILIGFAVFLYSPISKMTSKSAFFDNSTGLLTPLDYSDVFLNLVPTDLFEMTYYKTFDKPKDDTMNQIARKYGLTKIEAEKAVAGSLSVILQNTRKNPVNMTQKQAQYMVEQVQKDYLDYKETFEMQQEIEMSISSTELFSNGILTDSSFDLIHDLEIIEQILFEETSDTRLSGNIFEEVSKHDKDEPFTNADLQNYGSALDMLVDQNVDLTESEDTETEQDKPLIVDELIENTYGEVAITDAGACSVNNENNVNSNSQNSHKNDIFENYDSNGGSGYAYDDFHGGFNGEENNEGDVINNEDEPTKYDYTPYVPKKQNDDEHCFGGDKEGDYASVSAEICITYSEIMGHYGTIIPGQTCISCELEKTNSYFEKTLSHSLMPNKLTGNLGENAKCKKPYKASAPLDLKFIAIPVPIPTTPNVDIVVDGDPIAEWNKMMSRNGYNDNTIKPSEIIAKKGGNDSIEEESAQIKKENEKVEEKAERAKTTAQITEKLNNVSIFTNAVYNELDQFHIYLKNELKLMKKSNKSCSETLSKPTI